MRYPVDHRSLSEHDRLILHALRLYYERDLTQAEVAGRMGFSRPKVTRLIAEGRARGLVDIRIAEPAGGFASLEISLKDRYGLNEAVVVPTSDERRATDLAAGSACGALLGRVCSPDCTLGISWGVSVRALADAVPPMAFGCGKVVPIVGGMGKVEPELHSNRVAATLADKLGAESSHLAAPAIARSARSRDELMEMPGIQDVLEEAAACDVAVVGIGDILPTATMVQAGYFTLEEFLGFGDRGAAGDVCCHFVDAAGAPRLADLSERVVGLTPTELEAIPETVGIATGADKVTGVAGVLRSGCVKALVCDQGLAQALLGDVPGEADRG